MTMYATLEEAIDAARWIPRKDAQQLMSGMNVNHSYGP